MTQYNTPFTLAPRLSPAHLRTPALQPPIRYLLFPAFTNHISVFSNLLALQYSSACQESRGRFVFHGLLCDLSDGFTRILHFERDSSNYESWSWSLFRRCWLRSGPFTRHLHNTLRKEGMNRIVGHFSQPDRDAQLPRPRWRGRGVASLRLDWLEMKERGGA